MWAFETHKQIVTIFLKKTVDNSRQIWYYKRVNKRDSGGIGRHKRLKISRSIEHAGSSPACPTI